MAGDEGAAHRCFDSGNLLFNAERRKRLDRNRRDAALESLERMALNVLPGPSLHDLRSIRIYAEKHQLTPYDAEYLRVAREQGLMLASLDRNLLSAARREKLRVVGSS
jgi:predicted nucleic acid-binding protein